MDKSHIQKMTLVSELLNLTRSYDLIKSFDDLKPRDYTKLAVLEAQIRDCVAQLYDKGLCIKQQEMTIDEILDSKRLSKYLDKYLRPQYLVDVPYIDNIVDDDIPYVYYNLDKYIEDPIIPAFLELCKKGYKPYASSGNFMDLTDERITVGGEHIIFISLLDDLSNVVSENINARLDQFGTWQLYQVVDESTTVKDAARGLLKTARALPKLLNPTTKNLTDVFDLNEIYKVDGYNSIEELAAEITQENDMVLQPK